MAGISSKAAGKLENKRKWNAGSELNTDLDVNLYETFYRSLDPQIGRFWQIDPKTEKYYCLSSYLAMADNPVLNNDPLGDDLVLTGSNKDVDRMMNDINRILNGFFTASIDKKGKVSIVGTDKKGEKGKQVDGFYSVINKVVTNPNGTPRRRGIDGGCFYNL